MPHIQEKPVNNRLMRSLPQATVERLAPALQYVQLKPGQAIDHIETSIDNVYFVNSGFVSLVKTMRDGRMVEIGGFGVEGVTDPWSLFGVDLCLFDTMVQIPGDAFRIRHDILKQEMNRDPGLWRMVEQCLRFALKQMAQTSACNRLHSLEERCCRWLLIARSNVFSDTFLITHEYLATMLGAPRASVSVVAHGLKEAGILQYVRGDLTILNQHALEERACECYSAAQEEIEHLYKDTARWAAG